MNPAPVIKILLVEDDEDDFIITRDLLKTSSTWRFELDWVHTFDAGLRAALEGPYEACLVDYRLGAHDGIELLQAALAGGCQSPIILLTGQGEHEVDMAAMNAGAADYLVKNGLESSELERSLRYAIERKRAAAKAASEQARLAAFGAEVGLALTRRETLETILERCARAMAQYLRAGLAQIWSYDPEHQAWAAQAAAGELFAPGTLQSELPAGTLEVEALKSGKPVLIKTLASDSWLANQAWLQREHVVSFAALPLLLEDRLVGVMSLYSTSPLAESVLQEMTSVAHGVALCIERKRSALALDASEGKYRSVVENIREIVFQLDTAGHWIFLNPAWMATTGIMVSEALGTHFLHYIAPEDRPQNHQIFQELTEGKTQDCRYETRLLTRDGERRWMEVYAQIIRNGDGTAVAVSGSLNDITERKKAEEQIQKLAAFPRVNPNPVLEFTAEGGISYFNDAAKHLADKLDGSDLPSILPPNCGQIARECLSSGENRLRLQRVVAGHTLTWSFFPVAGSQIVHCYGADVTDVVSLEAQFRQAQKLESIGQLAAGIAHDFNNILTVIQGYSDRLLIECEGNSIVVGQVKQISESARRATALTRQLLTFSRKHIIQTRIISLNTVVRNLGSILSRLLGEDVELKTEFAATLPSVEADPGMIEQVVMNLAVNARDAMPKGGKLRVATSVQEVDAARASSHVGAKEGRFVCLEVTDTGCGMSPEILSRIFEPFFSTKEVGKGTGLGLATVYGIVKQHDGWIEVTSKVGLGTTFNVFLPAVDKPAEVTSDTSFRWKEVRGGQETILLVEDEPALREMVCEILQGYRYKVVSAANGVEALKLWDENEGRIDLLLTDLVMPEGMNGRELVAKLSQRRPDLKVIYTSGYSAGIPDAQPNPPGGLFLAKPFRPPALARLVRECLDGTAS